MDTDKRLDTLLDAAKANRAAAEALSEAFRQQGELFSGAMQHLQRPAAYDAFARAQSAKMLTQKVQLARIKEAMDNLKRELESASAALRMEDVLDRLNEIAGLQKEKIAQLRNELAHSRVGESIAPYQVHGGHVTVEGGLPLEETGEHAILNLSLALHA